MAHVAIRRLPRPLEPLRELALDLRWTWSHGADEVWRALDPEAWERTQNPWVLFQEVPDSRLEALAASASFREELGRVVAARARSLAEPTWFGQRHPGAELGCVAYFSMEFGLGEALPLYAGGLGILAGDYLKASSDLGVPAIGVGLLYQEGYFRQQVDAGGWQQEAYPFNDPESLPVRPAIRSDGSWVRVSLDLPGRPVLVRVWCAKVGRATLLLLDSNDPLNGPFDRGITGKLYGGGPEQRLLQEMVLGIGGWRALQALGYEPDVCHLNEGHAALAALARAAALSERSAIPFASALWASRAGNLFTTHTSVVAGFDTFAPELVRKYFRAPVLGPRGPSPEELLAFGRLDPGDGNEPLNMAYLAMRTCSWANAVSRLHGEVSRAIFQDLFPRWPRAEVPIGHVTNGVHVPSWDSRSADRLWTVCAGKARWLGSPEALGDAIQSLSDAELWAFRTEGRRELARYARERLAQQLGARGVEGGTAVALGVLDPDCLTLGFARRFVGYKRPNLLLADPERLARLLGGAGRPAQLVVAGKAHPGDEEGRRLVRAWVEFVNRPAVRNRAVFLEDYDIALAQKLVEGVDVWINTPRRPWEACGTSGMKVLVNGGLNLSELDGWWSEAYQPGVGWALGDGAVHAEPTWDSLEAGQLYRLLEEEVIPEFYDRDSHGVPRRWVARMRASMARLAPRFSTNRMMHEYVEQLYLPAARACRARGAHGAALAKDLAGFAARIAAHWGEVRFGELRVTAALEGAWRFEVEVYSGALSPDSLGVELYAEPAAPGAEPLRLPMERAGAIAAAPNGHVYRARVPAGRPPSDYTARVLPFHPEARLPIEERHILWQR
jgi:starch phosphorylase